MKIYGKNVAREKLQTKDKIKKVYLSNKFKDNEIIIDEIVKDDKERMLIELIRNKNTIPFDYYKEIINNYREIEDEIDMSLLADYLESFTNGKNIFETRKYLWEK